MFVSGRGDAVAETDLGRASAYHLSTLAEARNASPRTIATYGLVERRLCTWLSESLGRSPTLADLTPRNVVAWCDYLRHTHESNRWDGVRVGHSADNIRQHLVIVKSWSRFLADEHDTDDPLRRVKRPRQEKKVVPAFTPEEVTRMVEACASTRERHRNRAMVLFLYDCAVRVSELCGLQAAKVDPWTKEHLGRALVLGKGRKERYVYFGSKTWAAIRAYVQLERPDDSDHTELFLLQDGRAMTPAAVLKLCKNLGVKAGVQGKRVSPHVWRHSGAIAKIRAGVPLQVVQASLGHERIEQTLEYARINSRDIEQSQRSVVDGMDSVRNPGKR